MKTTENPDKKLEKITGSNDVLKHDLTLLKKENVRLESQLNERDIVFQSIPVGIMLIQQGKIVEVNETLLKQLGYDKNEIIGRHFLSLIHTSRKREVREIHKKWETGKIPFDQYDTLITNGEGNSLFFSVNAGKIRLRNRALIILSLTLLEKRREIEYRNIKAGRNNAQIVMARGFAERLRSLAESVPGDSGNNESPGRNGSIEETRANALSYVRAMNTIAAMENAYSKPALFDLNRVINDAVDFRKKELKNRKGQKDIRIRIYSRSSSKIEGNPGEMKEALDHLLNNSIEAMPRGGDIIITTEEDDTCSYIYLQDSGTGIPEEIQDSVIEPFFSVGKDGAPGLGLSLSNAIIRRHRGTMEISSRREQGTIIQITLPSALKVRKKKIDRATLKNSRILIIQDRDLIRGLMVHLLKEKGCRINTAENGLEGLAIIKRKNFDMVISDTSSMGIPESVFLNQCKKINSSMPLVMIRASGKDHPAGMVAKTLTGLDIVRPFDINRMVNEALELLTVNDSRN